MNTLSLYGLVLAGGRSTRMGSDKGLLQWHGKSQREHLFDVLGSVCENVYTSCRAAQQVDARLNPLPDLYDLQSPLSGIMTAFQTFPTHPWLIVAVDMPHVDRAVLDLLISNRDTTKVATCFRNPEENFPEPLLTLWEPAAFPLLQVFVDAGNKSPRDFLQRNDIALAEPPHGNTLMNINYPHQTP